MLEWQAVEVLNRDLDSKIAAVESVVKVPMSDNQWIALCSFCFNVGVGAFTGSELLWKLNSGNYAGAADEFLRWKYQKGKELPGLVRRREAARALFLKG